MKPTGGQAFPETRIVYGMEAMRGVELVPANKTRFVSYEVIGGPKVFKCSAAEPEQADALIAERGRCK